MAFHNILNKEFHASIDMQLIFMNYVTKYCTICTISGVMMVYCCTRSAERELALYIDYIVLDCTIMYYFRCNDGVLLCQVCGERTGFIH